MHDYKEEQEEEEEDDNEDNDDEGNDFDTGHVSQSSCDSEVECKIQLMHTQGCRPA